MSNIAEKKTTQELSDWFYGLQMTVRILEGLMTEYDSGTRDQDDFESRFTAQSHLLVNNLKKIKPLTEKIILEGYSKYVRPERPDSESELHSRGGDRVVAESQIQTQES